MPWFVIGLLSGVFGFIASVVVGEGNEGAGTFDPEAHDKKCPDCAERIKLEARVCKHCGHEWTDETVQKQIEEARPSEEESSSQPAESPLTTGQQWAAAGGFFAVIVLIGIFVTVLAGG